MNAVELIFRDTLEYYMVSSNQITIQPHVILSELGTLKKEEELERHVTDRDVIFLDKASLETCDSGFWEPIIDSQYYANEKTIQFTKNNRILVGENDDGERVQSGILTFYDYYNDDRASEIGGACGWARDVEGRSYIFCLNL